MITDKQFPEPTVRIGIIGVGNIGSAHASCLFSQKVDGLTLTVLCDSDESRGDVLKARYPSCRFFTDYREAVDSGFADAFIVAVPHPFHATIAEYVLSRRCHLLLEKPIDIRLSAAESLIRIAENSDRVFAIMFNQRTNPVFSKVKQLVESGVLGEPKRLQWTVTNWYRTQQYYDSGAWRATWNGEGGGVLVNQAPHNLDLWQWIFGMPKRIHAFCQEGKYHRIDVEDDVTIYAEYENGATALFVTSTGEYPGTNRLEITGDRGRITVENGKITLLTLSFPERKYCFDPVNINPPSLSETVWDSFPTVEEHRNILQNFSDAIRFGTPLIAPGAEGIHELRLSCASYLSAWNDSFITLPPDAEEYDRMLDRRIVSAKQCSSEDVIREAPQSEYRERWKKHW